MTLDNQSLPENHATYETSNSGDGFDASGNGWAGLRERLRTAARSGLQGGGGWQRCRQGERQPVVDRARRISTARANLRQWQALASGLERQGERAARGLKPGLPPARLHEGQNHPTEGTRAGQHHPIAELRQ